MKNTTVNKMGHQYILAMMDVDHFKKFNDTYGHDVGDLVLKMAAHQISLVNSGSKLIAMAVKSSPSCLPTKV